MQNGESNELDKLLNQIGIKFHNTKLLQQAFIHRSYLNEIKESMSSNERLEFLGDAILSFIISTHLFEQRPNDEEGDLTNLRSYIVKTKSLAEAAQNLHLGDYLKLSKGEEISGGRNNIQLLANTFESLIGAVFLDQGLEETRKFIAENLLPLFEKEVKSGPPKDAKSELQEVAQNQTKQSPDYKIVATSGPDHAKEFVIAVYVGGTEMGRGVGNSKQVAEEEAAAQALKKLANY